MNTPAEIFTWNWGEVQTESSAIHLDDLEIGKNKFFDQLILIATCENEKNMLLPRKFCFFKIKLVIAIGFF